MAPAATECARVASLVGQRCRRRRLTSSSPRMSASAYGCCGRSPTTPWSCATLPILDSWSTLDDQKAGSDRGVFEPGSPVSPARGRPAHGPRRRAAGWARIVPRERRAAWGEACRLGSAWFHPDIRPMRWCRRVSDLSALHTLRPGKAGQGRRGPRPALMERRRGAETAPRLVARCSGLLRFHVQGPRMPEAAHHEYRRVGGAAGGSGTGVLLVHRLVWYMRRSASRSSSAGSVT